MKSPFEALIDDLAALRDRRQIDANARAARQAHESARNRRLQQTQQRPLRKSAPVAAAAPPDFNRIARQQAQLETALQQTAARAERDRQARVKADCRAVIADLRQAARRGELPAAAAAKLDAMIGQAARMGLQP